MKVLILKNYTTTQPWGRLTIDSIRGHITRHETEAEIVVCNVCDGDIPPYPNEYDLVVLTGGTFNLIADAPLPWVTNVIDLVRAVSGQQDRHTKLLGFCWGHQVIHHSLGARLDILEGSKIGIEKLQLTPPGQSFFRCDSLNLHKYHKRCVMEPAKGFNALADGNEIFLSRDEQILTFQAHPELTEEISRSLIAGDDGSYTAAVRPPSDASLEDVGHAHDGEFVWDIIMSWVKQG